MAPISKKLCGRPNGSKNKPKSTSRSICQPIESSVKLVTINVVSGKGVMETILDVACCDHVSLTVLNAFGMIKNVIICNPWKRLGDIALLAMWLVNSQERKLCWIVAKNGESSFHT